MCSLDPIAPSSLRRGLNIELNHPPNFERLVLGCMERFRDKSEKSEKVDGCHREQARFGRTANHYCMYRRKKKTSWASVSKPNVASKYSFCSIFRDLQDWNSFAPLQTQIFGQKSWKRFAKLNIELNQNLIQIFIKTAISQPSVDEMLSEFRQCAQK